MRIQTISSLRQQKFGEAIVLEPDTGCNLSEINYIREQQSDSPFRVDAFNDGHDVKTTKFLISDGAEKIHLDEAAVKSAKATDVNEKWLFDFVLNDVVDSAKTVYFSLLETFTRNHPKWADVIKFAKK